MNDDQIKHMVSRFLNWKLPENFNPDGGISFVKYGNIGTEHQYKREPSGTNLIGYAEATEMMRHMIEGMPGPAATPTWLDIKTAPHDVSVLLGYPDWHSKKWVHEVGPASHGWTRNGISTMSRHGQATHWMPLPDPPVSVTRPPRNTPEDQS